MALTRVYSNYEEKSLLWGEERETFTLRLEIT